MMGWVVPILGADAFLALWGVMLLGAVAHLALIAVAMWRERGRW